MWIWIFLPSRATDGSIARLLEKLSDLAFFMWRLALLWRDMGNYLHPVFSCPFLAGDFQTAPFRNLGLLSIKENHF